MTEDKNTEFIDESNKQNVKPAINPEPAKHTTRKFRLHLPANKTLLVVGVVAASGLLLGGAFVAGRHAQQRASTTNSTFGNRQSGDVQLSPNSMQQTQGGSGYGGGFSGTTMQDDGDTSTTSSATRVSGVVTAVDGDTITVAGNGTTKKVTVSSNTTYTGSSEPAKVNDTIVAFGAKDSSGTLVASTVRLTRE